MNMECDKQKDFFEKCGELFFNSKGNIIFHCSLCEDIYKDFDEYNCHILDVHIPLDQHIADNTHFLEVTKDNSSFHYLSEQDIQLVVNDGEEIDEYLENETFIPHEMEIMNYGPDEEKVVKSHNQDDINFNDLHSVESSKQICRIASNLSAEEEIRTDLRNINIKTTIKNRKYQCPICGFLGADRANMKSHIKRHSKNKPHQCTECTKSFHTRTELNTHLRTHTGERPYLCTLCGMSFVTSSQLCSHQKRHNDFRSKECPKCDLRFHDLRSLRGHMVVHSDKRNYKCKLCDASFKLSTSLTSHMKLHENKREYHCKFCDSRFNQRAGLYSHLKNCHTVVAKGFAKVTSDK